VERAGEAAKKEGKRETAETPNASEKKKRFSSHIIRVKE
jgi:hypothetical protein